MGVPSYFAWLYREHKKELITTKYKYECNVLYLDFNCLIHPACKKRVNMTQQEMFQSVLDYYHEIVNYIKPKKLIYIAIDGVVPLAKMDQQRKRRYRSAADRIVHNELQQKYNIPIETNDFNMISPGTQFMQSIDNLDYTMPNCEVIVNPSSQPGEGEHKIMDHIRSNNTENAVVYGLDADLIFLCLLNYKKNCILFRESTFFEKNPENGCPYYFVKIPEMRIYLHNNLVPDNEKTQVISSHYVQKTIVDYAYLCFLHGNDFLPHIPSMLIREGALEIVLECYKQFRHSKSFANIINKNKIVYENFLQIIEMISEKESEQFSKITNKRISRIKNYKEKIPSTYKEEIENYNYIEHKYEDKVRFGTNGWKERYLKELHCKEIDILEGCQDYCNGMAWSLCYYTNKCIDWRWHYTAKYVPCISDLLKHLKDNTLNPNFILKETTPLSVDVQLLYIMPPKSIMLLPERLRSIMIKYSKYYPHNFEICTINKKLLWECEPILPELNIKKLEKEITS